MTSTLIVSHHHTGYYEDGSFGIRIENIVVVQPAETKFTFGGVQFLRMEHVTIVPISTKLVDTALLSPDELKWLNDVSFLRLKEQQPTEKLTIALCLRDSTTRKCEQSCSLFSNTTRTLWTISSERRRLFGREAPLWGWRAVDCRERSRHRVSVAISIAIYASKTIRAQ